MGGPKAREEKVGGRKEAKPPYTLCRPPPLLKARVEGAPRALGSGQRWGASLAPPSSPRRLSPEGGGRAVP